MQDEPRVRRQPRTVAAGLALDFTACFVATAALVACDGALVLIRAHPSLELLLIYTGMGAGLAAWVAALFAMLLVPAHALGRSLGLLRLGPTATGLLCGLGYAALSSCAAIVVLQPWQLPVTLHADWPLIALGALILCASLVLSLLWQRSPRLAAGVALAGAAGAWSGDALVLGSVYPRWHQLALLVAIAAGTFAAHAWLELSRRRVMLRVAGVALLLQLALLPSARAVVELGADSGLVVPRFVALARFMGDRDGDRFARVLSGGDCDDSNEQVFPGQCEKPANGIDDNCNGLVDPPAPVPSASVVRRVRTPRPDVYFILIDGMRADLAGQQRQVLVPEIARFAGGSLDFRHAYSSYPSTFRSVTTLLSSRYWRYLSARDQLLLPNAATAGWDVALWIRDVELRDVSRALDLGRRDDPFHVDAPGKEHWTEHIVDRAIAELDHEGGPRMRWLHVLDTHSPWLHGRSSQSPRAQYQAEIAFASRQLGRFFQALDATARGRRAVVVLFADHGEALGEHHAGAHGGTLYEELLHVPLLMRLPGVPPQPVTGLASLLDVVPTLSHYLGLPSDPDWQGFDWLERCDGEACQVKTAGPSPRVLAQLQASAAWSYAGLPALETASDGRFKLLVDLDRGRHMFFDLHADPGELHPLVSPPSDVARALEGTLAQWEDLPGCSTHL